MFSFLQCIQRFIRSRNIGYSKTRLRSWRSLLVSFGIFPSEQTTLLHFVSHDCRTTDPMTTCPDMKLRFIAIKSLSRASAHLSNAFPANKSRQSTYTNNFNANPIATIIPPQLLPFESWECSLAHLFSHIIQSKWPERLTPRDQVNVPNPVRTPVNPHLHPYAHLAQGIIFWNIRTFRPVRTLKTEQRQRLISKWAKEKKIICLLETHLVNNEHLALEQALQITCISTCVPCSIQERPARPGPIANHAPTCYSPVPLPQPADYTLNRKACVSIIIHRSLEPSILQHSVLIPGYALLLVFAGLVGATSPWDQPFILIAWYINPNDKLHCIRNLFAALRQWKQEFPQYQSLPLLIGGDFNFSASGAPKFGYVPYTGHSDDLLNEELGGLEELCDLQEKFPNPYVPTWHAPSVANNMKGTVRPAATLDRVFISRNAQAMLQVTAITRICELELSDHTPLEISASNSVPNNQRKNVKRKFSSLLTCPIPAKALAGNSEIIQLLRSHTFNILAQHGYADQFDFGINVKVHDACHVDSKSTLPNPSPIQDPALESGDQPGKRSTPGIVLQTFTAAVRLWYMFFARNQRTRKTNPLSKGTLRKIRLQLDKIEQASNEGSQLKSACSIAQLAAMSRNLIDCPCLNPQQSMA